MILGAGLFQLPAIRKAVELGYQVVTVDYLPENVGHRYSHHYVNRSTTDLEGVYQAAEEHQIDGICTFSSDVAVPTVGFVAEKLGLKGPTFSQTQTLSYKHKFREFLERQQLPRPQFASGTNFADLDHSAQNMTFPALCKPVDTSGSRGVTRLDHYDAKQLKEAFGYAQSFSRSDTVCLEQFLEGIEVGGDALFVNGKLIFIAVTNKYLRGFAVTGHSLPSLRSDNEIERVRQLIQKTCHALGFKDGPINFDVMLGDEVDVVLEMSPRNGGNGIPIVIHRSTGVDIEQAALQISVDDAISINEHSTWLSAGSYVFGAKTEGEILAMTDEGILQEKLPFLRYLHYTKTIGDTVVPYTHSGHLLGFSVFDLETPNAYESQVAQIDQALNLKIGTPGPPEKST